MFDHNADRIPVRTFGGAVGCAAFANPHSLQMGDTIRLFKD